jgi:2-dehydro-3-deoxygalactonokinase
MQHPDHASVPVLVAVDWGTTSLRAWALASTGAVLGSTRSNDGLRAVTALAADPAISTSQAFARVLSDVCVRLGVTGLPTLACGMVGSAGGWSTAEQLRIPVPATPEAFGLHRVPDTEHPVWIVPGLRTDPAPGGAADVIRGEETQVLGALARLGHREDVTLVLPGTHSKWVRVADGAIAGFATAMTGELHAALLGHTILGDPARQAVPAPPPARSGTVSQGGSGVDPDAARAAFDAGVEHSLAHPAEPLAARLFTGRTRYLAGSLGAREVSEYVSGLLIGDETERMLAITDAADTTVALCADGSLGPRYRRALERQGVTAEPLEGTALDGLTALARAAGLLTAVPAGA